MRPPRVAPISLRPARKELLVEILAERRPSLIPLATGPSGPSGAEARQIQDVLSDELCATGLGADDVPNERGLSIEELIDAFSQCR